MSKLDSTSETAIAVVFLVMNLEKWLNSLLFCFLLLLHRFSFGDNSRIQSPQIQLLTRQLITTAIVIPAQAGIQTITGSRINPGVTEVGKFDEKKAVNIPVVMEVAL